MVTFEKSAAINGQVKKQRKTKQKSDNYLSVYSLLKFIINTSL